MKFFKVVIKSIFIAFLSFQTIKAQGCSDAGFCTISGNSPSFKLPWAMPKNHLKVGVFFGKADHSIYIWGNSLQYTREFNQKWSADVKINTLSQSGYITTSGFSDVFLSANYQVLPKLHLTFGAKLPLSDASKTKNGIPLPMDYQSSLGTFDLITGMGYSIEKIMLNLAIQQPLSQNNNAFFSDGVFSDMVSTNEFKRSGDILLRISYPFNVSEHFLITPSFLPIYHLSNDQYRNKAGELISIENSKGLTLNLSCYADYQFDKRNKLQLNMGFPVITRKIRPDGLTRAFVTSLEYTHSF